MEEGKGEREGGELAVIWRAIGGQPYKEPYCKALFKQRGREIRKAGRREGSGEREEEGGKQV